MELCNCFIIHPSNPHSLSAKLWPQLPFVSKSKKICIGPFSSWREQVFGNVSSNTILFRQVFKSKCQTRSTKISIESATTPREVAFCTDRELNLCLPFQTLKTFPREELLGKVVMVRFDSKLCPRDDRFDFEYTNKNAINTLKYLCNAGAKVVIVTHWVMPRNSEVLPTQIVAGWRPVEIGPKSLNGIASVLKECKTTLWIGPVKLWPSRHQYHKSLHFTRFLSQFNASGCTSIAIGKEAYNLLKEASCSCSVHPIFKHGAAVWEFLKGNTLAGVAALDRAFCLHQRNNIISFNHF